MCSMPRQAEIVSLDSHRLDEVLEAIVEDAASLPDCVDRPLEPRPLSEEEDLAGASGR